MRAIDLIIFDLDGTLVDSKEGIANSVNFALKKVGAPEKSKEKIISYIGVGIDYLIRKSLGKENEHLFAQTKAVFEAHRRNFSDNAPVYPGVKEVLEYFKQKRKVIATNGKSEFALLALKRAGIDSYFVDIVGGDDLNCRKPSACLLDMAMERLNVNKEKTIIVGDMDLDMLAGKKAGVITCAVTYGIGKKEALIKVKPDYMIDNILTLREIIN